jgi:hypothetical protein
LTGRLIFKNLYYIIYLKQIIRIYYPLFYFILVCEWKMIFLIYIKRRRNLNDTIRKQLNFLYSESVFSIFIKSERLSTRKNLRKYFLSI